MSEENSNREFVVPEKTIDNLLQYLSGRPWGEVNGLIVAVSQAKPLEVAKPEPPPSTTRKESSSKRTAKTTSKQEEKPSE